MPQVTEPLFSYLSDAYWSLCLLEALLSSYLRLCLLESDAYWSLCLLEALPQVTEPLLRLCLLEALLKAQLSSCLRLCLLEHNRQTDRLVLSRVYVAV
jgi:hypothetical protein